MAASATQALDELVRAGVLLTRDMDFRSLMSSLVEQSIEFTKSDLACLYLYDRRQTERRKGEGTGGLRLMYRRGRFPVAERLGAESEFVAFLEECKEAVVLSERMASPFAELLLHERMQSGVAFPLATPTLNLGVLIINSITPEFYNRERFHFLDSIAKLAGGMLHNSRMYQELKDYLSKIEALERYQESIFSSMTNLLVTTDRAGRIRYFNAAAKESMGFSEEAIGSPLEDYFAGRINNRIIEAVGQARGKNAELLGLEGIYKGDEREMDFALNVSPLRAMDAEHSGLTLLFTDQSKEKELQSQVKVEIEERRVIKDMFSRYLSQEVVASLMEAPDQVKPGGSTKFSTVFFCDIRGYTSFSEGQAPEYIVEVLNAYFQEAVEIVVEHKGYIDKFIGDCIMAAWGIPLDDPEQDALNAVSCAVEIQKLVKSSKRKFFRGRAERLQVGIGMHSGPLIAGNLGSDRRMEYTVIGDTVNVAARLEGVSGAGEIIITESTREYLGDRFLLEKRKAVTVKGKSQPIPIYAVAGKAR